MITDNEIKNKALAIITQYFGHSTAELYTDYYKDKDPDYIKKSLSELLSESIGPSMAAKIIQDINL